MPRNRRAVQSAWVRAEGSAAAAQPVAAGVAHPGRNRQGHETRPAEADASRLASARRMTLTAGAAARPHGTLT